MAGKNKTKVETKPCPFCRLEIASSHTGVISIIGDDESKDRFKGKQLYCGRHFHKILRNVGLSVRDIAYLKNDIFKTDPNIHQVFTYALALSILKEDDILKREFIDKDYGPDRDYEDVIISSITIDAEKNLPGVNLSLSITSFSLNKPSALTEAEKVYKQNLISPEAVIDFSLKLRLQLNITDAMAWAYNLNNIKYKLVPYVPAMPNLPLNVNLIAKFMEK